MAGITDAIRRVVFQRSLERRSCRHLDAVRETKVGAAICEACVREGTRTVHLRMCLTCGQVACCDSSPAQHARRHHELTRHPLIRSAEPGEQWVVMELLGHSTIALTMNTYSHVIPALEREAADRMERMLTS